MSKLNKRYADSTILVDDLLGANNGVAQLDGTGRIPSAQLPTAATEYKGAWNASTNTPTLVDGTGTNGDLYRVSVDGSQDLGSGSISYVVGDLVIYDGSIWQRAPENSSFAGKTTTDLAEGTNLYYTQGRFDAALTAKSTSDLSEGTNLYFTTQRVQDTVLADFTSVASAVVVNTDSVVESVEKLQAQITGLGPGLTNNEEAITLIAGDITNGYYDLAATPLDAIVQVFPDGGLPQVPGADFSVSTNRVTFLGDLASELIAGDVIVFNYLS